VIEQVLVGAPRLAHAALEAPRQVGVGEHLSLEGESEAALVGRAGAGAPGRTAHAFVAADDLGDAEPGLDLGIGEEAEDREAAEHRSGIGMRPALHGALLDAPPQSRRPHVTLVAGLELAAGIALGNAAATAEMNRHQRTPAAVFFHTYALRPLALGRRSPVFSIRPAWKSSETRGRTASTLSPSFAAISSAVSPDGMAASTASTSARRRSIRTDRRVAAGDCVWADVIANGMSATPIAFAHMGAPFGGETSGMARGRAGGADRPWRRRCREAARPLGPTRDLALHRLAE
jgi:hypothetical protein